MSLLDAELLEDREWLRVGDAYEVTKKPRGLDMASLPAVPFVPMNAIPQGGGYDPNYTLRAPDEIRSGTYFERGDALIAKITPSFENGKQALATELPGRFGFATTEVIPLRPREEGQDRRLLFFYLLHPDVRYHVAERMEGSTGRQRVPTDVLLDLPFPEFEPEEQTAIADLLEMIQRLKATETQTIQTIQSLKRAAMQTLFTRGLRGEPQKETEIGPVPESWICNKLGTLADITYGAQAAVANALDPEIGTLILTNINLELDGRINLEKRRYYNVPEEQREKLILRKGDILFNWRSGSANHVGKTVFFDLDGEYTYSSFILRLRPHRLTLNEYLFRWLTYLRMNGFFTTQRNVSSINSVYNASLSATIPIWFPDNERQSEIVAFLDTIDRKIGLHRRKRAVLEELFKALLHKLMTGEMRIGSLDSWVQEQSKKSNHCNPMREAR